MLKEGIYYKEYSDFLRERLDANSVIRIHGRIVAYNFYNTRVETVNRDGAAITVELKFLMTLTGTVSCVALSNDTIIWIIPSVEGMRRFKHFCNSLLVKVFDMLPKDKKVIAGVREQLKNTWNEYKTKFKEANKDPSVYAEAIEVLNSN